MRGNVMADYTKPSSFRDHGDGTMPARQYVQSSERYYLNGKYHNRITLELPDDFDAKAKMKLLAQQVDLALRKAMEP